MQFLRWMNVFGLLEKSYGLNGKNLAYRYAIANGGPDFMPDSSQKPLLIFDFDGTLANTIETGVDIYNEIAPEYGLKTITMEEARELRKLNLRAVLDQLGISRIMAVKIAAHLRKLIHDRMDEIDMIDGAKKMIQDLHSEGFQMGIISSNSTDNVRQFMERFGLTSCFGFIEAGVSLFGKAHRLKSVLKAQGVSAANSMYVGDETRDMEAARKANVAGIAVCWGANDREAMNAEGPSYCIEDPEELIGCALDFAAA